MSDDTDDVKKNASFGWLFSTFTALGLLLFLAMSFAFYHRRQMIKRRREAEYNQFFRFLRPDLENKDKKITRARSILTNTHNTDLSFTDNEAYYNEAFVGDDGDDNDVNEGVIDDVEDFEDNEFEQNLACAERDVRGINDEAQQQIEDHDLYLRSVKARKQILLAEVHSEEIYRESDNEELNTVYMNGNEKENEVIEEEHCVNTNERVNEHDYEDKSVLQIRETPSKMPAKDSKTLRHIPDRPIISNKPPFLKPISKLEIKDELVMNKTSLKPIKYRKKKRSIFTKASERKAVSLSEENVDMSSYYSKPRRGSEPPLFLYEEEAADPKDSTAYKNQNKILYNPYYTEVSMPLNENQKRRSCTAEDMHEVDIIRKQNLNRERSMPVTDEIYDKHVPASTWM